MEKSEKIQKIIDKSRLLGARNASLLFLPGDRSPRRTAGAGFKGFLQNLLKGYGRFYYFLLYVFSPVYGSLRPVKKILEQFGKEKIILNLGSGPNYYMGRKDLVNIDIFAFQEVDIVADAHDLPIAKNSVDLIINTAMLEHVEEPGKIVDEMYRVTRPGGYVLCYVPFIVPFHPAPSDFFRWTSGGARKLFSRFSDVTIHVGGGPTSGMLWVFQEWLSTLLSFGSRTLHDLLFLLLMLLTFPIKFLDIVLAWFPTAENIASGFYITARKS
ncbi:MAG: class I SAM-dependent methyltransferase [bacterium]